MGNRRFVQTVISDDDEDGAPAPAPASSHSSSEDRKRKKLKLYEEDEEVEEARANKKARDAESSSSEDDGDEAKPIGPLDRISGTGRSKLRHYQSYEFEGFIYNIEDSVLFTPEDDGKEKPYAAIIKDITQAEDGSMMVTGQWFYRPQEAEKKGGGNWEPKDTRELFYSFHCDDVPAGAVMHKCVIHFIPLDKKIPIRKQNRGFFVQKVYDFEEKRLYKLSDKDYEDDEQHEIDLLVQKTLSRLGDLSDIENEDASLNQADKSKNKRMFRRKIMSALDVLSVDEETTKFGQTSKTETPGSVTCNSSEYYTILASFNVLTGETMRDKWLERLLKELQFVCTRTNCAESSDKAKGVNDKTSFLWPEAAVSAVTALEKASHAAFLMDLQKYNQKMRHLTFNLKTNALLARRLLNGELEPSKILIMSPVELKEASTAEELAINQPEESGHMQMIDARCKRCMEKKVGLIDIIKAARGDRYQLECISCGNTWYASRDEVSSLSIDSRSPGSKQTTEAAC